MITTTLDHPLQFDFKLRAPFWCGIVGAWHVLPYKQAQFVAPIIPSLRLNFDVLSRKVETGSLQRFNIKP